MAGFHGTVRLDERGRLVLPAEIRNRLGLKPGDELLVSEDEGGVLHVSGRMAAARALIGIAGPSAGSAVDELRELRRQDAAGDSDDISHRRASVGRPTARRQRA